MFGDQNYFMRLIVEMLKTPITVTVKNPGNRETTEN